MLEADDVGSAIAEKIRRAARREGVSLDQFRKAHGFRNTAFFRLLRGESPKSIVVVRQLKAAGLLSRSVLDRLLVGDSRGREAPTLRRSA